MSLEGDLEPRLEKIKQLTRDRYVEFLEAQYVNPAQTWRIRLNQDGVMVAEPDNFHDPAVHGEAMAADLERWQSDWQDVSGAVSDLIALFQSFYVIDLDDADDGPGRLEEIWRELGGRWQRQEEPGERETGRPPDSDVGTAYDQLAYARYYMDEEVYNQLLRIRDYEGTGEYGGWSYSKLDSKVWDGPAAAAFFHILVVPFDEAAARQIEYVRTLAANIHLLRVARDRITRSLRQIVDNCIAGLNGDVEPLVPSPDGEDINSAVGLVAAVAGLLTATTGGTIFIGLVGLGSAVVSIGMSAESKQEEPDHIDLTVASLEPGQPAHPGAVIESCQDAVGRVKEWIASKDEHAGRALERDMSDPYAYDSQQLWLREPGEFSDRYDFDLTPEAKQYGVQAPIDDLREAGRTSLPGTLAGLYDDAIRQVTPCVLPAWVNRFLPRTYGDYHDAQDGLVHLLRTTRNNLGMWGDELVEVANGYAQTDADNAGNVDRAYN